MIARTDHVMVKNVKGQEVAIFRQTAAKFRQRRYGCSRFQFCL